MNLMIRSVCLSAHLDSFCTRINEMLGGALSSCMRRMTRLGWTDEHHPEESGNGAVK